MTQTVKLPNGDTLNFPDDMPDDAIAKAIADNYPEFAPKAAASRTLAGLPVRDADAPAPARADTPDVLAGMPVKKPDAPDAPLLDAAANTDPAQNQFAAGRLSRADYERQLRAMNPHAKQNFIDYSMAKYDEQHSDALDAAQAKRDAGPIKPIPSADQFFNDRLNKRLQQRDEGIVQVQPAHEQQDFSSTGTQHPVEVERPDVATQAGRDLSRGWQQLKGLNYGFWGLVADGTGHEEAADKLLGEYVRIQNDVAKNNPAVIGTYKNIHDLGDAGRYAVEALFENAPMIIPSLLTGGVGAKLSQAAATRVVGGMVEAQVAKGIAREVAEKNAASFIARRVMMGSAAGAAPATIGMESGSIYGDIYQDTGKKRADLAIGFGIPAGLLDIAEPVMALRKIVGPAADEMVGSVIKRLGVEAGKQFIVEAGTEAAQTYLEEWAKSRASGKDVNRREVMESVIDAALKGGIGGAGMGVGSEGVHEARAAFGQARDNAASRAYDNLGADGANAARDTAMSSWNTNGLLPSSRSSGNPAGGSGWNDAPAARREPTLGDIAAAGSVDEAIAAAEAVVSAPASMPAAPRAGLDPASVPSAADIDALEQQAGLLSAANPAPAAGKPLEQTPPADLPPGGKPAPALDPAGKSAEESTDWHPFPAEMRSLGVPRAQMPQIKAEHRGAMVNFLNARGISHEQVEVPAESLRPTQREFSVSKVDKASAYEGGNRSILISSDNYVLDGHHQWMAAALKGEPVQAIRLNAPIKELVKTVHEFPSATVDTASAPQEGLGKGARIGQTALDANAQRIQRQEDAVRAAAESLEKRKSTGGQRARERLKQENPFLGFLANHGVQIDERSDTGGQKGRAGGIMVPGYGPLYRKSGKRLDELAQLAHEAGFLSQQDIDNPSDTGGTRKLADMIQRAAHAKEVIRTAGLLDAVAPTADQRLIAEAQKLGLETEGKTADELYDAVATVHASEEQRRQQSGAETVDEQDAIDRYAGQIAPQLADADIPLDLNDPRLALNHDLTDEEIDEIFGIQKAGSPRADRGEAEGHAAETAHEGAARAGQPDRQEGQDLLTSYSAADLAAREEEAAARAKRVQAERDKLEARRKAEQEAKEARQRADATVDDFQLGQDPLDQLNRQNGLFDAPPAKNTDEYTKYRQERREAAKRAVERPAPEAATDAPLSLRDANIALGRELHAEFVAHEAEIEAELERRGDLDTLRKTVPLRDSIDPVAHWANRSAPAKADYYVRFVQNGAERVRVGETEQGPATTREFATVTEGPTAQRLRRENKLVFAQPRIHSYDAAKARPVVLIACSEGKLEGGPHRAIDLYDGVLFDVLRKWMPADNRPDVFIVSALHGLVHADTMLESYEQPMTQDRLEALMKKGIPAAQIINRNFNEVFLAGPAQYRELGQVYAEQMRKAGFLAPDASVLGSAQGAGIGTIRGDLADYLKQLEAKATPETKRLADELDAELARRKSLEVENRTATEARQTADSQRKAAQVKTPGTNLVWSNLAEWLDAYHQLDGRAASTKRNVQLKEHIGQLAKNPDKITSETNADVLEQAKAQLEKLQAGRGKRENDPATKAVQLIGTRLGEVQSGRAKLDNATAPEHVIGVDDRELGEIVAEFKDAQAEMMQDGHPVTNIFAPPKKKEIVRLADKARATGKMWDEKESKEYRGWLAEAKALVKDGKKVPAELVAKIEAFEKVYLPFAAKLKKEAAATVEKWKEQARAQYDDPAKRSINSQKVVLSFFDLSGEWSRPWEEAGYQVYRFDIQDDPVVGDVNNFSAEFFGDWFGDFDGMDIHAILAACPCTDFASSGSRHFAAKDADGRTVASVKLVHQTLKAIEYFKPAIWALENPVGRIEKLGGLPPWRLSFDPNHLGDDYTKKTMIWGRFNADLPVAPAEPTEGSKMWSQYGGKSMATKNARSETPEGFSYGFFLANNAVDHPAMALHGKFDRLDRKLIEKAVAAGVTEDEISEAVDDHYYMELDDDAANDAIRELIGEAKEEGRAPAADDIGQIPLDFYPTVTVPYRALGAAKAVDTQADQALASTREEIGQLEDMLKCMGA